MYEQTQNFLSCTVPIDFFKEKQVIHIGTALRANYC